MRPFLEPSDESRLEVRRAHRGSGHDAAPAGRLGARWRSETSWRRWKRARERRVWPTWIVAKESGDGLGFTDTKYFGQGRADVSLEEVEIGWMLTPAFSGQACATEAARAVRGEAFERLRLESIVAVHHPANASSGRIMEKLGMGSSATSSPATCGRLAFIA